MFRCVDEYVYYGYGHIHSFTAIYWSILGILVCCLIFFLQLLCARMDTMWPDMLTIAQEELIAK